MPKNTGKGGKNFKKGKHGGNSHARELVIREEGQEYAQVSKMLGANRVECLCSNGNKSIGVIRGAMRMKVWICVNDLILVSERDFEGEGKVDVLHKYTPDEAKELMKLGHIPPDFRPTEDREEGGHSGNGRVVFVTTKDESDKDADSSSEEDDLDDSFDSDDIDNI